jgi:hypothetical protein
LSDRPHPETLLRWAARLLCLAALGKARARAITNPCTRKEVDSMTQDIDPSDEARALAAELFDLLALRENGEPFDYSSEEEAAKADSVVPQFVALGPVRFKIIDADASHLAVAAGVMEPGSPALAMRVAFEQAENVPTPSMGQHVILPTDEPGVSIVFLVVLTHADLHAGPDLGPGAERNTDFDALEPGQGLLVQVFDQPQVA